MTTTYTHVQISNVDNKGDVNVLYPVNTGKDVSVDLKNNTIVPSTVKNVQNLVDSLGDMSFEKRSHMVFIDEKASSEYNGEAFDSEINDNITSLNSTWSSHKINEDISTVSNAFNNDRDNIVYLKETDDIFEGGIEREIDDSKISTSYTWSSEKIDEEIERCRHGYENRHARLSEPNDFAKDVINSIPSHPRLITLTAKKTNNVKNGFPLPEVNYKSNLSDGNIYWFIEYKPMAYDLETGDVLTAYQYLFGVNEMGGANPAYTPYYYSRVYMNGEWSDFTLLTNK